MATLLDIHFLGTGHTPVKVRARTANQAVNAGDEALRARCMR
jgi:hypothetical protein